MGVCSDTEEVNRQLSLATLQAQSTRWGTPSCPSWLSTLATGSTSRATTSSLPRKPADTRMNDWDQISNSGRCHVRPRTPQLGLPRGSVATGHL